jgi:hypothetical protein
VVQSQLDDLKFGIDIDAIKEANRPCDETDHGLVLISPSSP